MTSTAPRTRQPQGTRQWHKRWICIQDSVTPSNLGRRWSSGCHRSSPRGRVFCRQLQNMQNKAGWACPRLRPPGHGTGTLWGSSRGGKHAKSAKTQAQPGGSRPSRCCRRAGRSVGSGTRVAEADAAEAHLWALGSPGQAGCQPRGIDREREKREHKTVVGKRRQQPAAPKAMQFRAYDRQQRRGLFGPTSRWRFMATVPSCS
jgi:hypothetical protein